MDEPEIDPPPSDDVVAGELALGVLEGAERAAALRRALAEPAFAAQVEAWRERLGPLLADTGPVEPPAAVWDRVAALTGATAGQVRALRWWRGGAIAAGAVAAALAVVVVTRPPDTVSVPVAVPTAPGPQLVAQLSRTDGAPLLAVRYDAATGRIVARTANLPAGSLEPELWVIGPDSTPRSLGLVARDRQVEFAAPVALRALLVPGSSFALSMEPADGAPHAAPSTTPLGAAQLMTI